MPAEQVSVPPDITHPEDAWYFGLFSGCSIREVGEPIRKKTTADRFVRFYMIAAEVEGRMVDECIFISVDKDGDPQTFIGDTPMAYVKADMEEVKVAGDGDIMRGIGRLMACLAEVPYRDDTHAFDYTFLDAFNAAKEGKDWRS